MDKKIKSLTITHKDIDTDEDFNIIEEFGGYLSGSTDYSTSGKVVLEKSFNSQGEIQEKIEYKYDEYDRITSQLMYYDENEVVERREYLYNEHGILYRINKYYSEGTSEYTQYLYNEAGFLTEKKSFSEDHEHEETEVFEYQGGSIVREVKYDNDMKPVYEQKINRSDDETEIITMDIDTGTTRKVEEYDNEGRRSKILAYDKKDRLISRIQYNYEDNNIVRITDEKASGTETTILHYNDHGDVFLQEEIDQNDFYKSRVMRTYDDFLLKSTQVYINNYGKTPDVNYLLEFEYEFHE